MTTMLILLAVIIAAPLLYLATLDGSFTVRRSLAIAADRKTVFEKIRDLRTWPDWSPWLMHEPDTDLTWSETPEQEGGWYSWDGKIVGAGTLTHERFTGNERIDQRIEFRRPFKSVSQVWWELESEQDGTTLVHWNMAGRMPFLFRFMAKKLPDYVGKDYATGLYLLRAQLVPEAEFPRINFEGPMERLEQTALTIHFEGNLEAMKKAMQEGFPKLGEYIESQQLSPAAPPFTVYHKVDLRSMHFTCDLAMPVPPGTTSEEFAIQIIPGGRYYKTTLNGSYEFLELAWYQAYSHLQMMKLKPQQRRASMEVYENDPTKVGHSNEILTSILIPIK